MASPWQSPAGMASPWGNMVAGPEGKLRSFLEADGVLQDVEIAGRAVSETITRDLQATGVDLADALDPARVPPNPYSTQPRDVSAMPSDCCICCILDDMQSIPQPCMSSSERW
jgi:hypothetical protein